MDAGGGTSERAPVMGADAPRRYTELYGDDTKDAVLNGAFTKRDYHQQASVDLLAHEKITLTWTNVNAFVFPNEAKSWFNCCRDAAADAKPKRQILFNGLLCRLCCCDIIHGRS